MEGRFIENDSDPSFGQIIARLKKGKLDLDLFSQKKHSTHACSHTECNPQSEEHLVNNGLLTGPPLSGNVFLCKYGTVHVCSQQSCTLYGYSSTQTCPLSGVQWATTTANYDRNDYRTWKNGGKVETSSIQSELKDLVLLPFSPEKEEEKEKKEKIEKQLKKKPRLIIPVIISTENALEKARDVVKNLFYSKGRRNRNLDALAGFQKQAENAKHTYISGRLQQRQLPFLTDILRLVSFYLSQPLPLVEYEQDDALIEYYAHVIVQVWQKVFEFAEKQIDVDGRVIPPRIDFETVAVGVLYTMRQGLQYADTILLPADDFLLMFLPEVRDMDYFQIQKRKVTHGSLLLERTYKSALQDHKVTPDSLVLNASLLPDKEAKTKYRKLGHHHN